MTQLHGVILDVDGTLIDSNSAHARAWQEALHEYGYDMSFGEIRRLVGMGGDNLLPTLIEVEQESEQGSRIEARRGEIFRTRYLPVLHAFPEAHELLVKMRESGLDLIVATSAKQQEVEQLLDLVEAKALVRHILTSDDAERSKPAPDIVQAALNKAGYTPDQVMMLGDTPYDIEAATRTGVPTIALRCGGWTNPELNGAVAIYEDPADLLAHFAHSPLAPTPVAASS